TEHPGPAGAASRPGGCVAGEAWPLRRARVGLPVVPGAVGVPRERATGPVLERVPPPVPGRLPELPARPRVAGPPGPAADAGRRRRGGRQVFFGRKNQGARFPAGGTAVADRDEDRSGP